MLNCSCITWPVAFKRLIEVKVTVTGMWTWKFTSVSYRGKEWADILVYWCIRLYGLEGDKFTFIISVYNLIRELRENPTIPFYETREDKSLSNLQTEGSDVVYLNSSVGTVFRLMAGWLKNCGTIPNRGNSIASGPITEPTHTPIMKDWGLILGRKGDGVWSWPLISILCWIKNEWRRISTGTTRLHDVQRNLTLSHVSVWQKSFWKRPVLKVTFHDKRNNNLAAFNLETKFWQRTDINSYSKRGKAWQIKPQAVPTTIYVRMLLYVLHIL